MADTVGHSVLNNDYVKKHKLILGLPTYLKKYNFNFYIFNQLCAIIYSEDFLCAVYFTIYDSSNNQIPAAYNKVNLEIYVCTCSYYVNLKRMWKSAFLKL